MPYRQTAAVEARLQDNRTRILDVARRLVSEGGWAEAQIANVAASADIATGTVYRYFASKTELFATVLSTVSQREVDVFTAIAQTDATAISRLHDAISTFVRRAMRNPRLAYALIAEPCDREIDIARLQYRYAVSEVVRSLIEAGQKSKEIPSDIVPDIAASVIVGGFMEGLIGPLSPLNRQHEHESPERLHEIAALADAIATLSCRGVSLSPTVVRKPARKIS